MYLYLHVYVYMYLHVHVPPCWLTTYLQIMFTMYINNCIHEYSQHMNIKKIGDLYLCACTCICIVHKCIYMYMYIQGKDTYPINADIISIITFNKCCAIFRNPWNWVWTETNRPIAKLLRNILTITWKIGTSIIQFASFCARMPTPYNTQYSAVMYMYVKITTFDMQER